MVDTSKQISNLLFRGLAWYILASFGRLHKPISYKGDWNGVDSALTGVSDLLWQGLSFLITRIQSPLEGIDVVLANLLVSKDPISSTGDWYMNLRVDIQSPLQGIGNVTCNAAVYSTSQSPLRGIGVGVDSALNGVPDPLWQGLSFLITS